MTPEKLQKAIELSENIKSCEEYLTILRKDIKTINENDCKETLLDIRITKLDLFSIGMTDTTQLCFKDHNLNVLIINILCVEVEKIIEQYKKEFSDL
jgi:hypothetical protein